MHWLTSIAVVASVASALPSTDETDSISFSNNTPTISIVSPNLTTKWFEGSDYVQTRFLTKNHNLTLTIDSASLDTVIPGTVKRLAPGQRALVQVGVKNKAGVKAGTPCRGKATATAAGSQSAASADLAGSCGIGDFANTAESLLTHRTPDWFDRSKYGIFIHWGLYSVPAYGSTGKNENYAEWYWKWQHDPNDKTRTYQYHLETYGKDVNYDNFAVNFSGKNFDPKQWVDLFADAGAQYFVPTTKHHDGFAIFNFSTSISRRSTVHYGPRRDFLAELFAAAKRHQPHLRRGTYFSLPELYNPKYKHGGSYAGGPPTNPYTGATLEYTGYVEVDDFVADVQAPQMEALAYAYDTEMLWCDIGGPNKSADVMSKYDPDLKHPFDRKWESSRGMDPYSYGYNHVTPDDQYMTGEDIVKTLVDIVANNGNFLLDIGPAGDGSIPPIMQKGLRDAGAWIRGHNEAIFNTTYWSVTAGADPLRYTATADAFYIHHVRKPGGVVEIPDPVPYLPGDRVKAVGGTAHGIKIRTKWTGLGTLRLELPDKVVEGDRYVWTFKIDIAKLRQRAAQSGAEIRTGSDSDSDSSSLPYLTPSDSDSDADSQPGSPSDATPRFVAEQCLFCDVQSADLDASLVHMASTHSFVVPYQSSLVVDVATLIWYLHLVIYTYHECIACGSRRRSAAAAQQHMQSKSHCRFDMASPEMREFYDVSALDRRVVSELALQDEGTIRLASGKLISQRGSSSGGGGGSRRRLEREETDNAGKLSNAGETELAARSGDEQRQVVLDGAERNMSRQMAQLSVRDQQALAHLQPHEQRRELTLRKKQVDRARRAEWRAQAALGRKGNRTLMKTYRTQGPERPLG
ncbi:hypothetical protein ARSEF4850_008144 [Beauveria asiatica]